MKSSAVSGNTNALASQYNALRDDAYGGSQLHAHQQASPGLTLYVEPGTCFCNGVRVAFAGGNSPSFTAPSSHPRIDLLVINSSGTLSIVPGTEAVSPSVPLYPIDKCVLAEVYNVVGQTIVYDNANQVGGQGYVYNDGRPIVKGDKVATTGTGISATNSSGTVTSVQSTNSALPCGALAVVCYLEIIDNGTAYHWNGVTEMPFTFFIPKDINSLNIQLSGVIYVENGSSVINPVVWVATFDNTGLLTITLTGPAVSTGTHSYQLTGNIYEIT